MLWSGGKDSFASYFMASSALGTAPSDWLFVTFVPPSGVFRYHPLGLLERQSVALGVDHLFVTVDLHNWTTSYYESFKRLRDIWGVERIFSGDILLDGATVEDYWLLKMLEDCGIELTLPLAGMHAGPLFERLQEYGIDAVVTGVADWASCPQIAGQRASLELLHASGFYLNPHLDLAGEHGEYHTTVLAATGTQFVSPDEVASFERTKVIVGKSIEPMTALLQLTSPRLDLTDWPGRD